MILQCHNKWICHRFGSQFGHFIILTYFVLFCWFYCCLFCFYCAVILFVLLNLYIFFKKHLQPDFNRPRDNHAAHFHSWCNCKTVNLWTHNYKNHSPCRTVGDWFVICVTHVMWYNAQKRVITRLSLKTRGVEKDTINVFLIQYFYPSTRLDMRFLRTEMRFIYIGSQCRLKTDEGWRGGDSCSMATRQNSTVISSPTVSFWSL